MKKIQGGWGYVPWLFFTFVLFIMGAFRIWSGTRTMEVWIGMSDPSFGSYTAHYVNVGLLYVFISVLALLAITTVLISSRSVGKK